MATLNAVFKKVFGEALEPLGFVKIKGSQPYFVRVVPGGEIIHVIACVPEQCFKKDCQEFRIIGGVATVYRQSIDLTLNPKRNENWLTCNCGIYSNLHRSAIDDDLWDSIYRFYCKKDEESMFKEMKRSLEATKDIMLPVLDKITDFEKCIEYRMIIGVDTNLPYDDNFGNDWASNFYNEGLLHVKTNNQEHKKLLERILAERVLDNATLQRAAQCYKFFNDPELHRKTIAELERRKEANINTLRSYGLDL